MKYFQLLKFFQNIYIIKKNNKNKKKKKKIYFI